MRTAPSFLSFIVVFAGACSQIIGLSDYEKDNGGGVGGSGAAATGGKTSGASGGRASTGGRPGSGAEAGEPSEAGAGPTGGRSTGGRSSGGAANRGGSGGTVAAGEGGAISEGGVAGDAGAGGAEGGATTGGASPGTGGVATGGAGGTTGGVNTGGKANTGGTTGGTSTGGKGGAGGTGGAGGSSCVVGQELLKNGAFDATAITPWTDESSEGWINILSTGFPSGYVPFSTPRAAVLGGTGTAIADIDDDADTMTRGGDGVVGQDVDIPAGATQLTLSCYYRIVTEETTTTDDYDLMSAWFWDYTANDAPLVFHTWSNRFPVANWQQVSYVADAADVATVAGGQYSMEFYALVDSIDNTWFGVDNCSLKVTACN